MVNNPELALVKTVLAVAPKVAAMVNLFLKLPKKLIGLKRKKKIFLVLNMSLSNVFYSFNIPYSKMAAIFRIFC